MYLNVFEFYFLPWYLISIQIQNCNCNLKGIPNSVLNGVQPLWYKVDTSWQQIIQADTGANVNIYLHSINQIKYYTVL